MKIPRHPKLRGEWAEVKFLARASELGLSVSKPYGDCRPYDFIVEHAGHMYRVQVKSTSYKPARYSGYTCHVRADHTRRFRADALDILAAYVIPENLWYIIPYRQLGTKRFIGLQPNRSKNPYWQYREAWHLLLANAQSMRSTARVAFAGAGRVSPQLKRS